MGQGNSIFQSSYQSINNDILQSSKSYCVNVCIDDLSVNRINVDNSTVSGTVNIKTGCIVTGASCNLKSALDNTVINKQKNQMSSEISETAGLFTILNNLATIGEQNDINQQNYQNITNDTTQSLLSVCNFRSETSNNVNIIDIDNSNITGKLELDAQNVISNTKCTQVNTIKNYIQNSQSNSMTAKIEKTGCCATIFGSLFFLIIAMVVLKLLADHKKNTAPSKSES
jgi:hypothetical protein